MIAGQVPSLRACVGATKRDNAPSTRPLAIRP